MEKKLKQRHLQSECPKKRELSLMMWIMKYMRESHLVAHRHEVANADGGIMMVLRMEDRRMNCLWKQARRKKLSSQRRSRMRRKRNLRHRKKWISLAKH